MLAAAAILVAAYVSFDNISAERQRQALDKRLPVPDDFRPSYGVINTERLDSALARRVVARAVVPRGLSKEDVLSNIKHLAKAQYTQAGGYPNIGAVGLFFYVDRSEVQGAYSVARADFAPHGEWRKANDRAPVSDWGLDVDIADNYFKPLPTVMAEGTEVVFTDDAMLSRDKGYWMDEYKVLNVKAGQRGRVVRGVREHIAYGSYLIQYLVEVNVRKKKYEGWVLRSDVQAVERTKGLRVVEDEIEIDYPLNTPLVRKSPPPSLNPGELEVGKTYVTLKKTPLVPSHSPADPIAAILQTKQIPKGGKFKVLEVYEEKSHPWYKVTVFDKSTEEIKIGWINSIALLGR